MRAAGKVPKHLLGSAMGDFMALKLARLGPYARADTAAKWVVLLRGWGSQLAVDPLETEIGCVSKGPRLESKCAYRGRYLDTHGAGGQGDVTGIGQCASSV